MRKYLLSTIVTFLTAVSLFGQQPEIATWDYSQKRGDDGIVTLTFKAKIDPAWYLYNTTFIEKGPRPTSFEIEESPHFEVVKELYDVTTPTRQYDVGFKMDVDIFRMEATFKCEIKRLTGERFKVNGELLFQTCNGVECIMDEIDITFDIREDAEMLAAAAVATTKEAKTDKKAKKEKSEGSQGLLGFLLVAFAAGLGGVFTPCVFPMIPMTVSFFIAGGGSRREGMMKGIIFGLSVTLIYTAIGVIVALFQSTDATDVMGSHWIPNLLFAILFIIFAISFFGAFEITLPSGLANKADAQADKGGYIASFFVAVAMVIVSFSCTGPFVGSILAAAVTGGLTLKPILGMAAFGMAFSLPFVLFSLFPSLMQKMPQSGGWLNVVKVVFAFVLLAFSIKFIQNVDIYFGWGIISRAFFISSWIAIAFLLSLYLLGLFKTSHDSDTPSIGTFRLLIAIASFTFAIYLIPGLFGAPLSSLSGLLPPQDGSTIVLSGGASSAAPIAGEVYGEVTKGLCGPARYATDKNIAPLSLQGYYTVEEAIACGKELNKPVLLSFKAQTCSACKVMEANVWSNPEVLAMLKEKYVLAFLYVDDRTKLPEEEQVISTLDGKVKATLGRKLRDYQLSNFNVASQPFYVVVDHNEKSLVDPIGDSSIEQFLTFLKEGLAAFEK